MFVSRESRLSLATHHHTSGIGVPANPRRKKPSEPRPAKGNLIRAFSLGTIRPFARSPCSAHIRLHRQTPYNEFIAMHMESTRHKLSQGQRRLAAIMFTDMVGYTVSGQILASYPYGLKMSKPPRKPSARSETSEAKHGFNY